MKKIILITSLFFAHPSLAIEEVKVPVADGYNLTADYYEGEKGGSAAFILHQCTPGYGRGDWTKLAKRLNAEGITVLNVDLRGFGDSKSEEFDTEKGGDARMKAQGYLTKDAPLALDYFTKIQDEPFKRMALIGSSCGGAMNIINSTTYEGEKIVAYLSPGIIDIWITPEIWSQIPKVDIKASLYITSSADAFSTTQSTTMFQLNNAPVSELLMIKGQGHGVELFEQSPGLEDHMTNWIIQNLKD